MSSNDFIHQLLTRNKKYPVGFEECLETKENLFITQEHTHLNLNIEDNLHYHGTAAYNDSISNQVALFHPYHPDLHCLDKTMGFPSTPISFECPIDFKSNLPVEIKELLSEHKASKINIRPFLQNMPPLRRAHLYPQSLFQR